jgi:enoyl-CoA hydratase
MPTIDPSRYQMIKVAVTDGIATLTLSNPARRNAVNRQMHTELEHIWDDIDADDAVRVAILTGDAGTFCAGTDLGAQQTKNNEGRRGRPRTRPARRIFWNMMDCEKPVIAKVRGYAYGLGVNLALACDLVYASENAKFCDSHVKMGIAPGDGGAALWPLLIGFHRAKEMIMTGDPIEGRRAEQLGLVNYCLADDQLDAAVDAMARRLADGAPLAISYAKLSVNMMLKQMMAGAFETSLAYDQLTLYTQDHKEGANAFMEKRKPRFTGD